VLPITLPRGGRWSLSQKRKLPKLKQNSKGDRRIYTLFTTDIVRLKGVKCIVNVVTDGTGTNPCKIVRDAPKEQLIKKFPEKFDDGKLTGYHAPEQVTTGWNESLKFHYEYHEIDGCVRVPFIDGVCPGVQLEIYVLDEEEFPELRDQGASDSDEPPVSPAKKPKVSE